MQLAVLEGAVRIDGPSGAVDVPKKKTATFQLADAGGVGLAAGAGFAK